MKVYNEGSRAEGAHKKVVPRGSDELCRKQVSVNPLIATLVMTPCRVLKFTPFLLIILCAN